MILGVVGLFGVFVIALLTIVWIVDGSANILPLLIFTYIITSLCIMLDGEAFHQVSMMIYQNIATMPWVTP